jgi:hypothetical protein
VTGRAGPLSLVVLAAVAVAAVAIIRDRRARPAALVLLVTATGPVALALVASISRPVFSPRYLAEVVPLVACLVAIGIAAATGDPRRRAAVVALVVVLGLTGQAFLYRDPSYETPDAATALVLDRARAGDAVVFNNPFAQMPYQRYLDDTGRIGPVQADLVTDARFPTRVEPAAPLGPQLAALPPDGSVWVVENRADPDRGAALRARLEGEGGLRLDQRTELGEVAVERWTREP